MIGFTVGQLLLCALLIMYHKNIGSIIRIFYKNIYKNITIFNLPMWLIFSMLDVIINQVIYFGMKST